MSNQHISSISTRLDESLVEQAALDWFKVLGYQVAHGPGLAPDGDAPARADDGQVVLLRRFRPVDEPGI